MTHEQKQFILSMNLIQFDMKCEIDLRYHMQEQQVYDWHVFSNAAMLGLYDFTIIMRDVCLLLLQRLMDTLYI